MGDAVTEIGHGRIKVLREHVIALLDRSWRFCLLDWITEYVMDVFPPSVHLPLLPPAYVLHSSIAEVTRDLFVSSCGWIIGRHDRQNTQCLIDTAQKGKTFVKVAKYGKANYHGTHCMPSASPKPCLGYNHTECRVRYHEQPLGHTRRM